MEYTINDKVVEESVFIDVPLFNNLSNMLEREELDSELVESGKGKKKEWRTYLTNHKMVNRFVLSVDGKDHHLVCVPSEKLFIIGGVDLDDCDTLLDIFEDTGKCEILMSFLKKRPTNTSVHNINRFKGVTLWDFDTYLVLMNAKSL